MVAQPRYQPVILPSVTAFSTFDLQVLAGGAPRHLHVQLQMSWAMLLTDERDSRLVSRLMRGVIPAPERNSSEPRTGGFDKANLS